MGGAKGGKSAQSVNLRFGSEGFEGGVLIGQNHVRGFLRRLGLMSLHPVMQKPPRWILDSDMMNVLGPWSASISGLPRRHALEIGYARTQARVIPDFRQRWPVVLEDGPIDGRHIDGVMPAKEQL